ncbi:CDGSH iron-sulfur domain-containing protein [uncultured Roseibium sp.]|uniref:CDGSH iron-sulfur domain-containing protein n=1 Tax=uncultured Roseibium sp. TaxID=1936171 RepID=UPI00341AB4B9
MKTRVHAIAGGIGFLMILLFWTSTALTELFASHETVATVKALILRGMFILIPAMVIAGGSGMTLGKNRTDALANAKRKRMPVIAANGLMILLPAAWFLAGKAAAGEFDTVFYAVQVLELCAGAANLTMMGLNIRDGITMTGRLGRFNAQSAGVGQPIIEERPSGPLVAKNVPRLTGAAGERLDVQPVIALCRCGQSKNKPYCDGSHNDIGFVSEPSPGRTPDELRVFKGKQIDVHYNRLLCSHAGECGKRLNAVFDTTRDPWIVPDNADPDQIRDTVQACPSGALSWSEPGGMAIHICGKDPEITLERNGPFRVTRIRLASGVQAEGASADKYVLCRCGASKNKPFCDGSHSKIGWTEQSA